MLSKLEKAIAAKILPISIDYFCEDSYLVVDITDEVFWVGYENSGYGHIGPNRERLSDYSKTLDEAVEKLIPILWSTLHDMEDGEDYTNRS